MLALVVADRDDVRLVEEDVAGHQHRVVEETGRHELLLGRLVLELRHAAQFAERRRAAQQPRRLGVRGHVALGEHDRPLGVDAGGEKHRRPCQRRLVERLRLVRRGDRVEVDDAENCIALLLRRAVLAIAA